jgi:hypothetical protein
MLDQANRGRPAQKVLRRWLARLGWNLERGLDGEVGHLGGSVDLAKGDETIGL